MLSGHNTVCTCVCWFLFFGFVCVHVQYKMDKTQLTHRTLSLAVWDSTKLGFNTFLGGIRLELTASNIVDSSHSLPLSDQVIKLVSSSFVILHLQCLSGAVSMSVSVSVWMSYE